MIFLFAVWKNHLKNDAANFHSNLNLSDTKSGKTVLFA